MFLMSMSVLPEKATTSFFRALVRDHIDVVALLEPVVAARDDRFAVARNGDRAVRQAVAVAGDLDQRLVDQRRRGVDLEDHQREFAAREVDVFGRAGMPQQVDDLLCRGFLRIEKVVDAHVDEHLLVVRFEVFVVVDPRDRFTGAELFGQHRRHDVRSLFGQYGDIQVGFADGRFFQGRKSRANPLRRR